MTAPVFGMQFSRPADDPVPVIGADFSKILIIETSEDADAVTFPVGSEVRFSTGDTTYTSKLGTGLLADYVAGINAQLNSLNAAADVTVVRVAEGADTAATVTDIVAVINDITSIPAKVNSTPRIVLAGRTAWQPEDPENPGTLLASPVVAALEANLGKTLAVAPVDVDDTDAASSISAREKMTSERILPIGIAAKVYKDGEVVERPLSPYVAGLMVRVDNENEGKPFDPFANRPIFGIIGTSRKIPFSLLDGSTEGQQMLAANVSIVVEGETGVDGAVADGGYVFIGTDNAQTGELWEQIHQVRGTDYLTVKMIKITTEFLGKKITASLVENWINSVAFMLRDHKAADDILGYTPAASMFKASQNSAEQIRLGTLKVDIGIEPCPVFKLANHDIRRYRPAVEGLVEDILARLNQTA
ncbi:hypothetical protein SAMN04515647_4377 [Cohaesibacter sp. ES.047]|uniref:phage tail protein n=1 Tax=Cohaesibacter sp. ES.047 TaxID=1798205 RepID=UPI000BB702F8|nr:phage tail protein [Cohaesibacter sp. ES.047]SNY94052.1 hypothetical protein SAMN04515647_4377 [Cohaesibacter sp. ES.047]